MRAMAGVCEGDERGDGGEGGGGRERQGGWLREAAKTLDKRVRTFGPIEISASALFPNFFLRLRSPGLLLTE